MSGGAPAVFTIPPGVAFVDALAEGLLRRLGEAPLALTRATILLPNRRAVRALTEAFLRLGEGRPVLLPRLVPLGDVDADELSLAAEESLLDSESALALQPSLSPPRRQFLLAQLVGRWAKARGLPLPAAAAADLAAELARLLDEAETAEVDLGRLRDLVPDRYASHWQDTLTFLGIVAETWPQVEREAGALSPAQRRRRLLALQAEAWRRDPPAGPVIAAGSTGSIPAVARLLAVIARLPQGAVVLPGLDGEARESLWQAILEDPAHPQHGLALLLRTLEVAPRAVRPWIESAGSPRQALIQAALRPARLTADWGDLAHDKARLEGWRQALGGLTWIDCPGPREEATTIALLLRRALERPGRTAALVTPDRALARRVKAELLRWDLAIDDSAGQPLADTPPLVFLRLLATAAAEDVHPVALLALLKHPLAAGGQAPGAFRRQARRLERCLLRGPRPAPGFAGLRAALAAALDEAEGGERRGLAGLEPWLAELEHRLAPFLAALGEARAGLATLLQTHLAAAEALAASDAEPGQARLWHDEAGEAAATAFAELLAAAEAFPPLAPADYPDLFETLLAGRVVRPRWGRHPRLFLWGPLEARLQQADLTILGGLNEGTWPADSDPGPWLSRPMRQALGLPAAERRIGQAAHDVAQALAAPEVVLTRAVKAEGAPTLPSRWLLRLEALVRSLGLQDAFRRRSAEHLGWIAALDRPPEVRPVAPPEPRPPLPARPRRLSVTEIETWMRNPYAVFARHVLKLRALAPLDEDPSAAERGRLIHRVLERFGQAFPQALGPDAAVVLTRIVEQELTAAAVRPGLTLIWGPRLRRIAEWVLAEEQRRRPALAEVLVETRGRVELEGPGGPFVLVATADRLERLAAGGVRVVDYKTGQAPNQREVLQGVSPQLSLEAAMVAAGGFPGGAAPVAGLEFWRLTGGLDEPGRVLPVDRGQPAEQLAAEAEAGLRALIAAFDDPATPYLAWPRAEHPPRFDDYAHLARIDEWAKGSGE